MNRQKRQLYSTIYVLYFIYTCTYILCVCIWILYIYISVSIRIIHLIHIIGIFKHIALTDRTSISYILYIIYISLLFRPSSHFLIIIFWKNILEPNRLREKERHRMMILLQSVNYKSDGKRGNEMGQQKNNNVEIPPSLIWPLIIYISTSIAYICVTGKHKWKMSVCVRARVCVYNMNIVFYLNYTVRIVYNIWPSSIYYNNTLDNI